LLTFGGINKDVDGLIMSFAKVIKNGANLLQRRIRRLFVEGESALGALRLPVVAGSMVRFPEERISANADNTLH
jgi:hypothetical protein